MRNGADLTGLSVLVVEDQFLLAMELEAMLLRQGCKVRGPFSTIEDALAALDPPPDAAVLDVDVQGRRVTPVVLALRDLGVPFVLVTGYSESQLSEPELRGRPRLDKPVGDRQLVSLLSCALQSPRSHS